jgi:hypothetical protein
VLGDGIAHLLVPQGMAYILGAEKCFALFVTHGADGTKFLILKNSDCWFHNTFVFLITWAKVWRFFPLSKVVE